MEKWGRTFFNKFKEKLKKQKPIIDELRSRTDSIGIKLFLDEREKLNELLSQEDLYWKQRAKLFWLQEGDGNTRFFHAHAFARKKANFINFLETEDGVQVDDSDGMCNIVKDYFARVFGEPVNTSNNYETSCPRKVTREQNDRLIKEVTLEEFTMAIKQMHPDKQQVLMA